MKTCFLIDDDTDDQEIFGIALEDIGIEMQYVTAGDGHEALKILQNDSRFTPDYIFLDLNMPKINGKQCLQEIKKVERLQHIPVIIYSTSSEARHKDEMTRMGAAAFITKPSRIDELSSILSKLFSSSW